MTKPLVAIGAGGHARVVWDAARLAGLPLAGTVAPEAHSSLPYLGNDNLLADYDFIRRHSFILGLGDISKRQQLADKLDARANWTNVIHPSAVLAEEVRLGEGSFVAAGAVINPGAVLGRHVVVNTRASIDHDCVIGDHCFIGPGATLAGGATCGAGSLIGVGACLVPRVKIGARTIVGAGAVVIHDLDDNITAVGCPARPVAPNTASQPRS
ncbi:MAG: acetyltransferase [Alphaproteobacteria bacterium]